MPTKKPTNYEHGKVMNGRPPKYPFRAIRPGELIEIDLLVYDVDKALKRYVWKCNRVNDTRQFITRGIADLPRSQIWRAVGQNDCALFNEMIDATPRAFVRFFTEKLFRSYCMQNFSLNRVPELSAYPSWNMRNFGAYGWNGAMALEGMVYGSATDAG